MAVHLNDFTKQHLLNVLTDLQQFFNVPSRKMISANAVASIYDALLRALPLFRLDAGTCHYIETMVRNHSSAPLSLEQHIVNLQSRIRSNINDSWSADFALRCLLAVFRRGELIYPDDNRSLPARIFGVGEMTAAERRRFEENVLQPIARDLVDVVCCYYNARMYKHDLGPA